MTFEEYEQQVSNQLINAHNNKNKAALTIIFRDADQTLAENHISPIDLRKFWEDVRKKVVYSPRLMIEKQANSALIVLMQMIEKEIAVRASK